MNLIARISIMMIYIDIMQILKVMSQKVEIGSRDKYTIH